MKILQNVFFTFLLAVAVAGAIMTQGCGAIAVGKAMVKGPERIDVNERLETLSIDYECRPITLDEELEQSQRRMKHKLHIACQPIGDKYVD